MNRRSPTRPCRVSLPALGLGKEGGEGYGQGQPPRQRRWQRWRHQAHGRRHDHNDGRFGGAAQQPRARQRHHLPLLHRRRRGQQLRRDERRGYVGRERRELAPQAQRQDPGAGQRRGGRTTEQRARAAEPGGLGPARAAEPGGAGLAKLRLTDLCGDRAAEAGAGTDLAQRRGVRNGRVRGGAVQVDPRLIQI